MRVFLTMYQLAAMEHLDVYLGYTPMAVLLEYYVIRAFKYNRNAERKKEQTITSDEVVTEV